MSDGEALAGLASLVGILVAAVAHGPELVRWLRRPGRSLAVKAAPIALFVVAWVVLGSMAGTGTSTSSGESWSGDGASAVAAACDVPLDQVDQLTTATLDRSNYVNYHPFDSYMIPIQRIASYDVRDGSVSCDGAESAAFIESK